MPNDVTICFLRSRLDERPGATYPERHTRRPGGEDALKKEMREGGRRGERGEGGERAVQWQRNKSATVKLGVGDFAAKRGQGQIEREERDERADVRGPPSSSHLLVHSR